MPYIIMFLVLLFCYIGFSPHAKDNAAVLQQFFEEAPIGPVPIRENSIVSGGEKRVELPLRNSYPESAVPSDNRMAGVRQPIFEAQEPALAVTMAPKHRSARPSALSQSGRRGKMFAEVIATAYYGPKPGQAFYATGSYSGDIELNGKGRRTASGTRPVAYRTVAVDPTIFPYGTKFNIPGWGHGIAEDTGRDIKGLRVDLFKGHGEGGLVKALYFGKRSITIEVMQGGW